MPTPASERIAAHGLPKSGRCTHRNYDLDCAAYDRLVADHGDRCAICETSKDGTSQGFLVIDHDRSAGPWAVRGLLCTRCNIVLDGYRHARTPAENAYLGDPWWRRYFARLGLPVDPAPEPAVGVTVSAGSFRWTRTRRGWERPRASHGLVTWGRLNYLYGPHVIRLVAVDSD